MRQQRPSSPCSGSIFLSLVADAAWKPRRVRLKRGAVDLLRGQLLGSSRFLAERWQWPEPRVRRFLDRISGRRAIDAQGVALNDAHSDALIDAQPTANGTIITIRNYDDFQKEAKSEPPSVGAKFDAQDDAPNDAPHDAKSTQREEEINNNTLLKESERTRAPRISFGSRDFGDWPEDFQTVFWGLWPHKVGKPAALKALDRVRRNGVSFDVLIAGVNRYIRGKPPDRSWMNPATFLNGDRWEDQPASEVNGQSISNYRADPAAGRATAREAQQVAAMGRAAANRLASRNPAGPDNGEASGGAGSAEVFDLRKRAENAR
jgi:hypothetical protein